MEKETELMNIIDENDQWGSLSPLSVHSSTFISNSLEEYLNRLEGSDKRSHYGRVNNSTNDYFRNMLVKFTGKFCFTSPSGLAAINLSLFSFLQSGDHAIAVKNCYGCANKLFTHLNNSYNVDVDFFDALDHDSISKLMNHKTKVIYLESPSSNVFELQDIKLISKIVKQKNPNAIIICDNTWGMWATNPLEYGADVVVASATKLISGHADCVLGIIATNNEEYSQIINKTSGYFGGYVSSAELTLAIRGIRTLPIRIKHQFESSVAIAKFLRDKYKIIDKVLHLGLDTHPQHNLWKQYFNYGAPVFSLIINSSIKRDNVVKMLDSFKLFKYGLSWGGFKSLLTYPNFFEDYKQIPQGSHLIRLNIGLEDHNDLMYDLAQGFNALT